MKHDYTIEDGVVSFSFKNKKYNLKGFEFIKFLRDNGLTIYFDNIQYHTPGFTYIYYIKTREIFKGKIKGDKKWIKIDKMPEGFIPKIKNIKPSIDKPFTQAEHDIN